MFTQSARGSGRLPEPAGRPRDGIPVRFRDRRLLRDRRLRARVVGALGWNSSACPPKQLTIVLGTFALLLASCLNAPLEPQPLTVTLTASQESASVGQEIRFRYESRGTNLAETVVEYGNGDRESVPFIYTGGAPVNINSQAGHFDYAYEEPGMYVARAVVSSIAGDSQSAEVTIQISGS